MTKTDDDVNEKYSEKVLSNAAWIDNEFLQEVLSSSLKDDVKILDHDVRAAVGAGDNFLSILYKTAVTYTTSASDEKQTKFLMIKGVPTAKIILDMIEEMGVFTKEIGIYNNILPAMRVCLNEYFMPDSVHVGPESYKCSRENTLVMEDLVEAGYKMANRREQLDFDHCVVTLRTLARFHALSVKLYEQDPEIIMSAASDFYQDSNREKMEQFLEAVFPLVTISMESWGDKVRFIPIMKEISKCIWDKVIHVVKPSKGFNVLNHGDMWVNNFLYKYDEEGNVTGAKLVDFQLSRYTTPALDLHYFFFTSVKPNVLAVHMKDLMIAYYNALTSDLAMLGLEVDYTFEQLEEDMVDRGLYAVLSMIQILPIVVAPPSELMDMDNMTLEDVNLDPNEHPMMKNYKNSFYKETAGSYMEIMNSAGYLEAAKERMEPFMEEWESKKALKKAKEAEAVDGVTLEVADGSE